MSKGRSLTDIGQCRTIESLQGALDQTYRRLIDQAKADWKQLFATSDPSDNSVSVHVSKEQMSEELAAIPRAGFAPIRKTRGERQSPSSISLTAGWQSQVANPFGDLNYPFQFGCGEFATDRLLGGGRQFRGKRVLIVSEQSAQIFDCCR